MNPNVTNTVPATQEEGALRIVPEQQQSSPDVTHSAATTVYRSNSLDLQQNGILTEPNLDAYHHIAARINAPAIFCPVHQMRVGSPYPHIKGKKASVANKHTAPLGYNYME